MKSIKVKMRYHNHRIINSELNKRITYEIYGSLILGIWVASVNEIRSITYYNLYKERLLNENYRKK